MKSPDPMRDVAQIRCDQTDVIKVDDLEGTQTLPDADNSTAFRTRKRFEIIGILMSSCGVFSVDGAMQLECRG